MSSNLLTDNLFQQVLLKPAQEGANEIFIVSGYASSAMAFHHAQTLNNQNIKINLIIGMTSRDGLSRANHQAFKSLMTDSLAGRFSCSYVVNRPPVHSKVYSWTRRKKPLVSFMGSANYSQQAFVGKNQGEIITQCNPEHALGYYQSLIDNSIICTHQDAEFVVDIYRQTIKNEAELDQEKEQINPIVGLQNAKISLLSKQCGYQVAPRSGLNWGQRPEYNRNPNQAYIQLSPEIYKSDFFPLRGIRFSVLTDDGVTLICTRAQKNAVGTAIETPHNNSLLGEYFRSRLGLAYGETVTKEHLVAYGRTDVEFYKVDEESYYMNFSA